MSRGPVARSDAIGERLPGSLVTLALLDIAAQNHATVEGAADPYPQPSNRAHGRARERTKAASAPRGGVGTHIAPDGGNRHTGSDRPHGTITPRSGTTLEGTDE